MSHTLVDYVSFGLQLILLWYALLDKSTAQPAIVQKVFSGVVSTVALVATFFGVSLGPAVFSWSTLEVLIALLVVAIAAPVVGIVEYKLREHGERIFAPDRFLGHLATNVGGALAAAAFVWVGRSTPGFAAFTENFKGDAAFNIVLPMATLVIFAFVRWQQVNECSDLDQMIKQEQDWKTCIRGFSLTHGHQLINTFYLIVVTFTGATMILYLFAYAIQMAKAGTPLEMSSQVVAAIVALLAFLFACGGPWSRGNRAVYMSFLTGTPAVLVIALIWFALLKETGARNATAAVVIGGGYILYCTFAVLGSRSDQEKVQRHYFSAVAFATILIILSGALYYSK